VLKPGGCTVQITATNSRRRAICVTNAALHDRQIARASG
jgi:hypothetical protein